MPGSKNQPVQVGPTARVSGRDRMDAMAALAQSARSHRSLTLLRVMVAIRGSGLRLGGIECARSGSCPRKNVEMGDR